MKEKEMIKAYVRQSSYRQALALPDEVTEEYEMLAQGLLQEIAGLLAAGIPPAATSLQAIGYKEPIAALRGEITMDEAVERVKRESRRYAKRQLTWLRRDAAVRWLLWETETPDLAAGAEQVCAWYREAAE